MGTSRTQRQTQVYLLRMPRLYLNTQRLAMPIKNQRKVRTSNRGEIVIPNSVVIGGADQKGAATGIVRGARYFVPAAPPVCPPIEDPTKRPQRRRSALAG